MHLCNRKFGTQLFALGGFKSDDKTRWASLSSSGEQSSSEICSIIGRFTNGTTGIGLIDASLRELIHTGYTSNRARQNVASFLTKHLQSTGVSAQNGSNACSLTMTLHLTWATGNT
jgi:deoxyribodipyrimidine photo-lyase